jgi:uncharacterized protein (DUF2141 family)
MTDMKTTLFFTLTLVLGFWGLQAQSGSTLEVQITNFESNEGKVYVALYQSADEWLEKRYMGEIAEITDQTAKVRFTDVPKGVYAISLYHDTNGNGELDTNFFGIPNEPIACSRNAVGRFGPPQWEDAKFEVDGKPLNLDINF